MAKYRHIYTNFWEDPKVIETFTPEDKLFYLYILTNNNTTQIGVYRITKKVMAFELGYSIESINSLMDRFISHHKILKYNTETRELAIKNWGKYNLNKGGKPVEDCVIKELKLVEDKSLLDFVVLGITNNRIKELFLQYNMDNKQKIGDEASDDTPLGEHEGNNEPTQPTLPVIADRAPYTEIIELYNNSCKSLSKVQARSKGRDKMIKLFWKRVDCNLDNIESFFKSVEASDFLSGRNGIWSACNFDWIIKESNYIKILEGNYTNKPKLPSNVQKGNYNNYEQREYDYDKLEKGLLGEI